ncbi:MAG: amidase family protein, partial [Pseudomonadota bacterium]
MADKNQAPLWAWSATEIVQATRAGALSAMDVTDAALARLEEVNPDLNAVVDTFPAEARAEAAARDADDGPQGPLHGVPVTIKVNVDQKGRATTNGVVAFSDVIAPDDAPVVRHLRAA